METTKMKKKRVCMPCRMAHSACDGQDPCRRCVAADTPGQCLPAPSRKRGRPAMGLFGNDAGKANPFSFEQPAAMNDAIGQAKRQRTSALVDSAEDQAQAEAGRVDGGYLGPLLSLLVEQVREVKRENASLRDELAQLTTRRVPALEDDNRRLHAELLRLREVVDELRQSQLNGSKQPPNSQLQLYLNPGLASSAPPTPSSFFNPSLSSSSFLSSLSSSDLGPLSTRGGGSGGWIPNRGGRATWAGVLGVPTFRTRAKWELPFLDDYASELANRPCVFDDVFNDIYAVFDMRAPADPQELCVNSPIFTFASPGYCAVTGYELEELVGKPIETISRTDKETLFIILVNIFAKPPSPVGDLWTTVQTWQHKNGTPLMLRLRHQIFYNKLWQPKWLVLVTESVLESPHLQPQNDILHSPDEFQRFRTRFPAFFDSLFTTARLKASSSATTSLTRPLSASFGVEQWLTAPLPSGTSASIRELDSDDSADTPPPQPEQVAAPTEVTGDYQLGDILSFLDSPRAPFSPYAT